VISGFSSRYLHPDPISFLNFFSKCWLVAFLQLSFPLTQTYNFTTDVNQSLNNRTRFTSYMRAIYADLLRESVPYREVTTRLRLKVWWCTSEARKYKKRDHNAASDNFLLNCNIAWKKAYCRSFICGIEIFTCALGGKFYEQMEALMQSGSQNVTKNKLLKRVNSMKIYFLYAGINL